MVKFFPMCINGCKNFSLFRCCEFRPSNLYFLLPILLNPNLGNSISTMRVLATSAHDMNMATILKNIRREHREDKT